MAGVGDGFRAEARRRGGWGISWGASRSSVRISLLVPAIGRWQVISLLFVGALVSDWVLGGHLFETQRRAPAGQKRDRKLAASQFQLVQFQLTKTSCVPVSTLPNVPSALVADWQVVEVFGNINYPSALAHSEYAAAAPHSCDLRSQTSQQFPAPRFRYPGAIQVNRSQTRTSE